MSATSMTRAFPDRLDSSFTTGPTGLLAESLAEQERQMIEAALAESRGRISGPLGAAAKLGIPRQTLDSKIVNLQIRKNQFKMQPAN